MIDAKELLDVRMASDRKSLRLRVRDGDGRTLAFSLPTCWLNEMLNALPRSLEPNTVHLLDEWSLDRIGGGQEFVLTLRTPAGQAVSFAIKSWQFEGMATIAAHGNSARDPRTIH